MHEYIDCKRCDQPNCKGCNINTLSKMLKYGKFDCIMDEHHSIIPAADVVEVRHGEWKKIELLGYEPMYECSICEKLHNQDYDYCNNCGAKMDGKGEVNERKWSC